jgi:alpha-tubulin suppressor-like RCC1 family protein
MTIISICRRPEDDAMHARHMLLGSKQGRHGHLFVALVLSVAAMLLGCAQDAESPTGPPSAASLATAAGTALSFAQLDVGELHTCGVTIDYRAYCWGWNSNYGALGDGTKTNRLTPTLVLGGLDFRSISAGSSQTCGITIDKLAYCWGGAFFGQLGDGTNVGSRLEPVRVSGGHLFRQITAGRDHTCGLSTANRVYCWGRNTHGQLGDGTTADRSRPVLVSGGYAFRLVSAGLEHTCGVTTSNKAMCWGNNADGRLGDGSTVLQRLKAVTVYGGRSYRNISAGGLHTCAVTTDYRAFCWGYGAYGQIGDGANSSRLRPSRVLGGLSFERVTTGDYHTCGEATDNHGYCWGLNNVSQLGNGMTDPLGKTTMPSPIAGGLRFSQLTAGGYTGCGKTPGGVGYCWGWNSQGEVGDGTDYERPEPSPVTSPS